MAKINTCQFPVDLSLSLYNIRMRPGLSKITANTVGRQMKSHGAPVSAWTCLSYWDP